MPVWPNATRIAEPAGHVVVCSTGPGNKSELVLGKLASQDGISDDTLLVELSGITDPAFLLVGNSAGTAVRKLTPTGWGLSNLLATVPAGRVPFAHTDGTVTSDAGLTFTPGTGAFNVASFQVLPSSPYPTTFSFGTVVGSTLNSCVFNVAGGGIWNYNFSTGNTLSVRVPMEVAGTFAVQQSGGTPGTHEGRVTHDGTTLLIKNMASRRITFEGNDGGQVAIDSNNDFSVWGAVYPANAGATLGKNVGATASRRFLDVTIYGGYKFASAWNNLDDTGVIRAAAKVVGLTDSSTGGGTLSSVPLAVSISADQNDYAPGVAMYIDLTTDGTDRHVTGLLAGVNGQTVYIRHVAGAGNLILDHESASSAAANRFDIEAGANSTVPLRGSVMLTYSTVISRWRAFPSKSCT